MNGKPYVCKRTYLHNNTKVLRYAEDQVAWNIPGSSSEINEVLKEYGFAKVCSALGVGVKVGSPDHPFEVICY